MCVSTCSKSSRLSKDSGGSPVGSSFSSSSIISEVVHLEFSRTWKSWCRSAVCLLCVAAPESWRCGGLACLAQPPAGLWWRAEIRRTTSDHSPAALLLIVSRSGTKIRQNTNEVKNLIFFWTWNMQTDSLRNKETVCLGNNVDALITTGTATQRP